MPPENGCRLHPCCGNSSRSFTRLEVFVRKNGPGLRSRSGPARSHCLDGCHRRMAAACTHAAGTHPGVLHAWRFSSERTDRACDLGQVPPVAIVWTDATGEWLPLAPMLRELIPEFYTLGGFRPKERTGPAI